MSTPVLRTITTFTIGGVDVRAYARAGSITLERYANGRIVFKATIDVPFGGVDIVGLEGVVYAVDSSTEFNGVVWFYDSGQMPDLPDSASWAITCVDMSYGLDQALINGLYGPNYLSNLLGTVINNAAFFGITLDPSQAGLGDYDPYLGIQSWEFLTLRQVLDRLGTQTTRLWRLNQSTLVLSMYQPYELTAPRSFDEDAADGSGILAGSLRVSRSFDRYVNDVWVRMGPSAPALVEERFNGNGVVSAFALSYTFLQTNVYGTLTYFDGTSLGTQTVSEDGTAQWTVGRAAGTLTRVAGALPVGAYVVFQYLANFPQYREFYDPIGYVAKGPHSLVVTDPGVLTPSEVAAIGNGILYRDGGPYRQVRFKTQYGIGLECLQAVTLNFPSLNINNSQFLISEIQVREIAQRDVYGTAVIGVYYEWEVVATEGLTIYDWLDELRGEPLPRGAAKIPQDIANSDIESVSTGLTTSPLGAQGTGLVVNTSAAWANSAYGELLSASGAPSVPYCIAGIQFEQPYNIGINEIDVAIGANQEFTIATFRFGGNVQTVYGLAILPIPYGPVAANTPVSARIRVRDGIGGTPSADTVYVKLLYYATVPSGLTLTTAPLKCWPLSALSPITLSGSAWVDSSWVQVALSTGADRWHIAAIGVGDTGTDFNTGGDELEIDVGVGGSGAEVAITTMRVHTRQAVAVDYGVVCDPVLTNAILPGQRVAIRGRHRRTNTPNIDLTFHYYEGDL